MKRIVFGLCVVVAACGPGSEAMDGGSAGGAAGGSAGGAAGGSAGGAAGGAAGGSAGGAAGGSAGGVAGGAAGGAVNPCLAAAHDAQVGTLVPTLSAHVAAQSATVPAELVAIAEQGSVVYGLFEDFKVKTMGAFPTFDAGLSLVDVRAPADRNAPSYAGYLVSNGRALLSGYTRFTAGYPGNVAVVQVDAGVQYVNAPGNFTAAGFSDGFVVNGTGLGTLSRTALFALNTADGGISQLAEIDAGTKADGGSVGANSGFTAVTASQVLLLGYFSGADFDNCVYAAPPLLYTPAVQSALPFALERATLVAKGDDIVGLSGFGNDALIVHGSYQTSGTYDAYTTKIERVPLTLGSLGVTVGAPVTLFTSADECTSVLFTTPSGSDVLVGIKDKNGRRVVRLTP